MILRFVSYLTGNWKVRVHVCTYSYVILYIRVYIYIGPSAKRIPLNPPLNDDFLYSDCKLEVYLIFTQFSYIHVDWYTLFTYGCGSCMDSKSADGYEPRCKGTVQEGAPEQYVSSFITRLTIAFMVDIVKPTYKWGVSPTAWLTVVYKRIQSVSTNPMSYMLSLTVT